MATHRQTIRRHSCFFFCLFAIGFSLLAPRYSVAASIEGLYTVTLERDLSAEDPRIDAIQRAMAQVITRVTGSRSAVAAPEILPLLQSADRYMDSFGFPSATEARVSFNRNEVNRALANANWPVWGAERPQTAVWIAVLDQFGQRAILSSGELDTGYEHTEHMQDLLAGLRDEITGAASLRGLPYVLPRLGARDLGFVDVDDIWSYSFDAVAAASRAYGADGLLIGRVRESAIGTDVEWLLDIGGERRSLPGASFGEGIDWLADTFAVRYRSIGGDRPLLLRVSGVESFDDYARVMSYLDSVSILSSVDVDSFSGSELLLRVQSRGDAEVLGRTLTLGNVVRLNQPAVAFGQQPGLPSPAFTVNVLEMSVVPARVRAGSALQ